MNHSASGCRYTGLDREYSIQDLAAFHGHLGPYIVQGYRMGRYVRKNFCPDPFQMRAEVYCEGTPPQSCLADGIQIGSGCTLGKRNIKIISSSDFRCEFVSGEEKMIIRPKEMAYPPQGCDDYGLRIEELAEKMYGMSDSDLFSVQRIS